MVIFFSEREGVKKMCLRVLEIEIRVAKLWHDKLGLEKEGREGESDCRNKSCAMKIEVLKRVRFIDWEQGSSHKWWCK